MTDKKNRIIIAITGFIIIIIPLFFLHNNIEKEITIAKDRIEESLQKKLLNSANKVTEALTPYNYLLKEFENIHTKLFPSFPKENLTGISDDNALKDLYNEKLLQKLIALLKEKYNPICITVGTQNLNELYSYYCPSLKKELQTFNEEKEFQEAKSYYDMSCICNKHKNNFSTILTDEKKILLTKLDNYLKQNELNFTHYLPLCYKYISRFKPYFINEAPMYSDYYGKQILYPIIKSTVSKNTIHGYYSLLIQQKDVDPGKIRESALLQVESNVITELDSKFIDSKIVRTPKGFIYGLQYPTIFINQIDAFKRLRNKDKSFLLNKQINLSIDFPKDYHNLIILNRLIKILFAVSIIVFIFLSIIYTQNHQIFKIKLSSKLLIILSLIIFLPITGIGLLTYIITHNINEIIELNASKDLHNSLENYYLLKDELITRRLSYVFELKKRISQNNLTDFSNIFLNNIVSDEKSKFWFKNFTNDLYVITDKGEFFHFDFLWNRTKNNSIDIRLNETDYKQNQIMNFILRRYINNLALLKTALDDKAEMFTMTMIGKMINLEKEEISVAKESVPNKDPISLREFDSSIYFYAKDKNNNKFYLLNKLNGTIYYNILHKYSEVNNLWFRPEYKYAYDTNLTIAINTNYAARNHSLTQIPSLKTNSETNDLINKIISKKDSGYEKIKEEKETVINEWLTSDESPYLIAGSTKQKKNTYLSYIIGLIFPFLLAYASILLALLNSLISSFIRKPINIYNEAINELADNKLGITIQPFSNDEFNNITSAFNEMSLALKQKEQIRRYVSDRLVQSVESNEVQKIGNGKSEIVTILSSDIRDFTRISEKYEPYEIVEMLNSYFTLMQQAISENSGIIDKYIGDAIQAVFYDEPQKENMVIRATRAALKMRIALKEYNMERQTKGLFTIENGIGIDTGLAITGTIGTIKGRKDFSVNGDVIARAAELEA